MTSAKTKTQNILYQFTFGFLIFGAAVAFVAAVHPDLRSSVRSATRTDFRQVLSTARGNLTGDGKQYTVAKIKTRDSLSLEVYETLEDGGTKLIERMILPDFRDGYFSFNGQATNLAIEDINEDGRPEILAPSFDQNLVGHLNVYTFNPDRKEFETILR
jgi:hypothetical protein